MLPPTGIAVAYCSYNQPIPFGYYRQPDSPAPKKKSRAARDVLMSMQLGDLFSLMDKARDELGFQYTPDSPESAPDPDNWNGTNKAICPTTNWFADALQKFKPGNEARSSSSPGNSE